MIHSKINKALFQKLPLSEGSSFLVERYESPKFETPWHFHEEYELVLCEKGYGKCFIGDSFNPYQEGEVYLLGKNLPHWFKADDSFYTGNSEKKPTSLVIQFKEDFLGPHFFHSPELKGMNQVLNRSQNGLQLKGATLQKIQKLVHQVYESQTLKRLGSLLEIFDILSKSKDLLPVSNHEIKGIDTIDSEKMHQVLEFALLAYKKTIVLKEVASLVNMSTSAFCRYFKSRTQKTFIDFVLDLRIEEAKRLLFERDEAILSICYECGFKNLSNFNRQFRKRVGMSPREFKKGQKMSL